jgi:hypothetical protein
MRSPALMRRASMEQEILFVLCQIILGQVRGDIPCSRHNPKILWIDDAEIVGDRIT